MIKFFNKFLIITLTYILRQGSIKEEVQIDLISQRLEKNRQQLNQRLNDVDSNLETILKHQVGF